MARLVAVLCALALIAAACAGESSDDDGASGNGDDQDQTDNGADGDGSQVEVVDGIYQDPRGGAFAEFQETFDRGDHPFTQVDEFCLPHDEAQDRTATDPGIEADTISLTHLRSQLEQAVNIGFGIDVGDTTDMFEVFAEYINEECGGIRGRMIDLGLAEAPLLGQTVDADRNAACILATEDQNAVIVMNSSGFQGSANLCIVEEHETPFISTQGQSEEFMRRGDDRLISLSLTLEESLRFLALDLVEQGALEGKTLGVASPDTPGQAEAVQAGLVDVLEENGFEFAVNDIIGCDGGTSCTAGVPQSVQRLRDQGVDVFFNVLNILSAPNYITEMASQGYEPGDVQFYASDFNSQAGELVSSKIVQFGGEEAGALYNGALIVDDAPTGEYRLEGYEPTPYQEMCNEVYASRTSTGVAYAAEDQSETAGYGMVVTVCSEMRMAARAIYDAGDNPTRADINEALVNLGPIDFSAMLPSTIRPGKTAAPDVIHSLVFEWPCPRPFPYVPDAENTCITPTDEYRPAPRE